ncbi:MULTISPECIES: c-type cytochrome biogenesis protein CcsB [Desulfococcus]|jgi:cytochrome c-type biogenesis protein CcsB|uniref:Heme exporter protein C n=1 Tax=Desulfococcus multivorans DSM 2059 TaxID=1121405 RepID=S7U540_DESML|nr:c-type cytochrome biogenesis protein CcsB [Desulfococcus multivorans]AOY60231.1 CcsA: cytochrome c biogenesis protein [Desulfococcus multivorans]AQV02345.1 c-type cytochrome biogenesis protein CcsB [Desulfococcus multivorans]EPR44621.1 cytochrome c-type biogenesis protein CcsB [Desulfococcus multivorans DSM 2059]MDX9818916.1 c-type cytochrome biogenesis protein CcsB [Desulfococcus multivorans]SKA07254.1 cytochrome c-type biogenesis protein CcsB [Desulfococcus multivorans DSM 2059]
MNSSTLLSVVTFVYGLSALLYVVALIFRKTTPGKIAAWTAAVGIAGNIGGVLLRWVESYQLGYGHAPLSNLYESLVFFAWAIAALYLFVEYRYGNRVIGAFVMPIAFLAMAYASLSPNISDRIQPLIPALKSNWLIAHVITCFLGYAGFAVAFGISLMFVIKARSGGASSLILDRFPDPDVLDDLTHKMVQFGFLFLSVGIITGAVWANSAWGRYWGWDPKETWSLITWFVYATLLHARLMRGWRGRKIAYISILGFMAVLFTYFGVNLLPGLHSYGSQ